MTCGVYQIQNTVNGKSYVGSSQNIEGRWRTHSGSLIANRHHSRHLQRAWELDGKEAFVFKIVLICEAKDLLLYEQLIMDFYKASNGFVGYNVSAVADALKGE